MKENLLNDWEKRFRRYLAYSAFLHISVFLFFSVRTFFLSVPEMDVSSAMLVELVALPDKANEDIAAAPTAAPSPEPPKPIEEAKTKTETKTASAPVEKKLDEAINLEKTRKKQNDALKRLQQQEALEKLQKELDQDSRSQALQNAKKQFKGNVLSPGSALTGTQKFVQQNYTSTIDRHFRSNWGLPQYLRGRDLSAEINVKFDEQGNVIAADLVKASGDETFDDMALSAVKKSSPVPPPPEQFVQISKLVGFLFRFRE